MNFRFFDDLLGSAPGAFKEFRVRECKHPAKYYSAKTIENFMENIHKILKISKIFQKYLVNFRKIKNKFEKCKICFNY